MTEINSFRGVYGFLSNMYQRTFFDNGIMYKSVEHFYQSHKTVNARERDEIRCAKTPMDSKRLGRKCQLRSHWEYIKDDVMEEALSLKFNSEDLKAKLIVTYPHDLVEGNTWGDTYWGVFEGRGLNMLGFLLMKLRGDLMINTQPKTREEILDKEMRILEETINMTKEEEVRIIEVTPENFDEIKDDLKFPENEAELEEFIKDNEEYHSKRIAKKQ